MFVPIYPERLKSMIKNRKHLNRLDAIAKESNLSVEKIKELMNVGGKLSINQATQLARFFYKDWITFLTPLPEEFNESSEYRTLENDEVSMTPELFAVLQDAEYILKLSFEIMPNHEVLLPRIDRQYKNNPLMLANYCRENLIKKSKTFNDPSAVLKHYKDMIESLGIFVVYKSLNKECKTRGFALNVKDRYIIAVNSKETLSARIFSLMHEFGHILINKTGICDVDHKSKDQIEIFCNQFATNFLVSDKELESLIDNNPSSNDLAPDELLEYVSNRLKHISYHSLAIRLKNLRYIEDDDFQSIIEKYKENFNQKNQKNEDKDKKSGGNYYYNTVNNSCGMLFYKNIMQLLANDSISERDVSRIIGIDENKIEKLKNTIKI